MDQNKILLVEDSKTFLEVLKDRVKLTSIFTPIIAKTYQEAVKQIDAHPDIAVAILDLVLPDAENGRIVDYVLSKFIPVIVLTSMVDESVRKLITKKGIVDYVRKKTIGEVTYSISLAEKLLFFKGKKALVVDDSKSYQIIVKNLLTPLLFEVILANSAEKALDILNNEPDVSLVFIDYNMPKISGLELTQTIRQSYKDDVIIIAITGNHSKDLQYGFLKLGADEFIVKPIVKEELNTKIVKTMRLLEQLEKSKNYAQAVEELSNTDFLTKAYNRSYLDKTFTVEIEKSQRYEGTFSIILIDIDYFKKVNDKYGHLAGDQVLVQLVQLLADNIRKVDVLGRWGGEEFLIICPHTNLQSGLDLADKLRELIEAFHFGLKSQLTCSFGVAQYITDDTAESLVKRADDSLYKAKKQGRNRVAAV